MTLEEFLVACLLYAILITIGIWGLILILPPAPHGCGMTCDEASFLCAPICQNIEE